MPQYSSLASAEIIGDFYPRFESEFAGSWLPALSTRIQSDKETETYKWLGQAPVLTEWLGERSYATLGRYSHDVKNVKYEATLRVDNDDLRRDSTGQIRVRIGEMAARRALHPEKLASTLILNGDSDTSGTAYDGQYFFDTDHDESGSDQVNDISATQVSACDVTTAAAPTPTEMAGVLLGCIAYMLGYTDDKGEPINGSARNWVVMVGTANLYSAAVQAIDLAALASGADNPLQGLKMRGMTITPIYNPRLAADTAQVNLFRSDGEGYKPFIYQTEVELEVTVQGADSALNFNEDAQAFGLKTIHAVGYGAWQHAAQITLS